MKNSLVFTFLFCCCINGIAQTTDARVSMESKRAAKTRISTNITLGGNFWSGNIDKSTFLGGLNLAATDSIKEFSFNAKYIYGENNNKLNQREFLTGLQYDYHPLSVFSPFTRVELYSNEFRNIKTRFSGLVGAKYRFYVHKKEGETTSDFSVSGAITYVFEKYTPDAQALNQHKLRLSMRPKIKQKLAKNIFFQTELYFIPKIICWEDYILYFRSNLNFLVNSNIFIKCSYEHEYESKPITSNIKKTDNIFSISLGISL